MTGDLPFFDFRDLSAAALADPYPVYRPYRELDPVHRVPGAGAGDGAADTWFVFRHDDVSAVLNGAVFDRGTSTKRTPMVPEGLPALRRMVDDWLVFMDPPRHTHMRNLVKHEFTPRQADALRADITTIAGLLADQMPAGETFDLVETFCAPFPIMVIARMLGVPWRRLDWFREVVTRLRGGIASRVGRGADGYRVAETATTELLDYFVEEIALRRRTPHDDVITRLVAAADQRAAITDGEIAAMSIHLLVAGHETTTNFLAKAVLTFAAYPDVPAELRAHPERLAAAVDELLRFDPPVQMVTRWARDTSRIGARQVQAGDKVVCVLGSANRDPACFADPDEYVPGRPGVRHRAFGGGLHFCLGAALARVEAEIGLQALLDRQVVPTGDRVPYAQDIVFHGPSALPVRATSLPTAHRIRSQA